MHVIINDEFKLKFEFLHFQVAKSPTISVLYFSSLVQFGSRKIIRFCVRPAPDPEKCLFYLEERTLAVETAAALEKSAGAPGLLQPSPPYFFPSLHRRRHPALQSQENRLLEKFRMYHSRPRRNILWLSILVLDDSLSFGVSDWFQ